MTSHFKQGQQRSSSSLQERGGPLRAMSTNTKAKRCIYKASLCGIGQVFGCKQDKQTGEK